MRTYFPQNNWEPFVYKRLNELIEQYKLPNDSESEKRNFVVFDFDNTSIIGDVEDNMMMYMLEHLLYKLTPEAFKQIITESPFELDYVMNEANPGMTPRNLGLDIIDNYTWLWENYIQDPSQNTLEEIKQSKYFLAFRAKLRYYYLWVNKLYVREAGKPWLTYWFQGYTPEELTELTKDMLQWAKDQPSEVRYYESHRNELGRAGIIESTFTSGLAFPQELIDLYTAFQENGILTYVVSASPIDIVRTAASEYEFNVPAAQVIGMLYSYDEAGRIQSHMAPESFITKADGKTAAIQSLIMSHHQQKEPIALFGDSMGDFHMMRHLTEVKLNVLFNTLNLDQTRELIDEAQVAYEQVEANMVVQGRDENTLELLPHRQTISIGQSDPLLKRK